MCYYIDSLNNDKIEIIDPICDTTGYSCNFTFTNYIPGHNITFQSMGNNMCGLGSVSTLDIKLEPSGNIYFTNST